MLVSVDVVAVVNLAAVADGNDATVAVIIVAAVE